MKSYLARPYSLGIATAVVLAAIVVALSMQSAHEHRVESVIDGHDRVPAADWRWHRLVQCKNCGLTFGVSLNLWCPEENE